MREIHLGALGMLGVTWATFFVAAIVSFCVQIYRATGTLSPKAFVTFAFPPSGWLTKSAITDVFMYVASKFFSIANFGGLLLLANPHTIFCNPRILSPPTSRSGCG